jgi:hypothetical protein
MKTIKIILFSSVLFLISVALYNCTNNDENPGINSMDIISMNPDSPSTQKFNDFVVITYNYNIVPEDGARMWIIPYTDGDNSPEYLYSSSKVYTVTGTREVGISIESGDGPVKVDQLKVTMVNPDQSETYIERFVSVDFTFEE